MKKTTFEKSYSGQIIFIVVGFLMVLGTLLKLLRLVYINSDWFWFIAGVGLTIEGILMLRKQIRFDRKYKIIER